MSELRLDGKVALITGSGRGLGRAYAHLLAARGAKVVVNDPGMTMRGDGRDEAPAQQVVSEIVAAGGTAIANFDSVATMEGAVSMVGQGLEAFGGLDIIINNAGNFLPKHDFTESNAGSFAVIWDVHVLGTINVIRAAWPTLCQQRSGRIINTTSHVGYLGNMGQIEYAAAKAAIHGITRTLAPEAARFGITVNAIAPGGMTRPNTADAAIAEKFSTDPSFAVDLVAPTVLWLAHEQCHVNGEAFGAMAGTTSRIVIAETKGYSSQTPTPEAIRDHFDLVMGQDALSEADLDFATGAEDRGMALVARFKAL